MARVGDVRRRVRRALGPAVERVRRLGGALDHALDAAEAVHPVELLGHQEEGGDRRGVVGLVLRGVVDRGRQVEERRDVPVARSDPRGPLERGRRHQRDPETAVGREALLRGEVVGVDLG